MLLRNNIIKKAATVIITILLYLLVILTSISLPSIVIDYLLAIVKNKELKLSNSIIVYNSLAK